MVSIRREEREKEKSKKILTKSDKCRPKSSQPVRQQIQRQPLPFLSLLSSIECRSNRKTRVLKSQTPEREERGRGEMELKREREREITRIRSFDVNYVQHYTLQIEFYTAAMV